MTKQTLDTNGVILNAKIEEVRVYREMDGGDSCFVLTLTQDDRQHTCAAVSMPTSAPDAHDSTRRT